MQQRKILLLENVASQAAGVREQLTRSGFQVAVSRYESDGLKRLVEWHPDLVLLSTAHPAGDFVEYCRRARPLAPAARFVVTSSLNHERLFQENPGLEAIVDGVLLRPYSHEEAAALLSAGPGQAAPAQSAAAAGRLVVVLDRDPELAALLRRGLEPHGVQVAVVPFEGIGAFCDAHRPAVVVLEWPVPPEFIAGPLARIRTSPGVPVAVLLLADSSQEAVSKSAPALVQTVDMFFRKPVAWEPFSRVLARHLGVPEIARLRPDAAGAPPAAPPAAAPAAPVTTGTEDLRAEFQRQLEAKFLEVEELRRQLDAVSRRAAAAPPGLEWLQSENEHLRQGIKDAERKSSLALATELLKRSEIEVKLDNLLRMKEDFEFRMQNEIDERSQQIEQLQEQARALRERLAGAERAAAEREQMRVELERALVEKEQLEERLHSLEGAAPAAAPAAEASRLAALEQEAARFRGEAAEAQAALADATAKAAVLEEALSRERSGREGSARELQSEREAVAAAARRASEEQERASALVKSLREETAAEQERSAGLEGRLEELRRRLAASETAAADARGALEGAAARASALERELAAERAARAEDVSRGQERQRELDAQLQSVRGQAAGEQDRAAAQLQSLREEAAAEQEKSAGLEGRLEELRRQLAVSESTAVDAQAGLVAAEARRACLEQELAAALGRARDLADEGDRLRGLLEESERGTDAQVRGWREKAAAAALELDLLRAQAEERAGREERERRVLETRVQEAEAATRESAERRAGLERALEAERAAFEARDEEARTRLAAQQALTRELEEKLAERPPQGAAGGSPAELRRIQELLEEVISRARADAVGNARREAEFSVRLQDLLEERRSFQERFERAAAEASERERRSAALLQSMIERGAATPQGRDNLPAVVPAEEAPRVARGRTLLVGLAVTALVIALAFLSLRRVPQPPTAGLPPAAREPAARGPGAEPPAQPAGVPAGAEGTPREVWDRWTRSDSSGGVLVQATLRNEQEVRAEVEAERSSRGWSAEETQAELARRLRGFSFDSAHYVSVYLKNLSPGHPSYFDDLVARFRLRDSAGREVSAFLPPGQEKERRVFTFGAGPPSSRIYEATVPLGFPRTALAPSPAYLQLIVTDVGAASRRVLTWELE